MYLIYIIHTYTRDDMLGKRNQKISEVMIISNKVKFKD